MKSREYQFLFLAGVLLPIIYCISIIWSIFPQSQTDDFWNIVPTALNAVVSTSFDYLNITMSYLLALPIFIYGCLIGLIGIFNFILLKVLKKDNAIIIVERHWASLRIFCGLAVTLGIICFLVQLPGIPMLAFGIVFASLMSADNSDSDGTLTAFLLMLMSAIILLTPLLILITSGMMSNKLRNLPKIRRPDYYFFIGALIMVIFLALVTFIFLTIRT